MGGGGFDLLFIPTSSCRAARVPLSEYLAVFSVQTEASERAWERQHASREDIIDTHFFFYQWVKSACLQPFLELQVFYFKHGEEK